jgi:hypothetical protein
VYLKAAIVLKFVFFFYKFNHLYYFTDGSLFLRLCIITKYRFASVLIVAWKEKRAYMELESLKTGQDRSKLKSCSTGPRCYKRDER